jgi:hypothetical protein
VKVIVKFVKKGIYYYRVKVRRNGGGGGRNSSCSPTGNGRKESKWWSLVFYTF